MDWSGNAGIPRVADLFLIDRLGECRALIYLLCRCAIEAEMYRIYFSC